MISPGDIEALIQAKMPDAQVTVVDRTGSMDHYQIAVVSGAFKDVGLMDRHRMVMGALSEALADGRLHAAELKMELPVGVG